jgi:hypothetical protein
MARIALHRSQSSALGAEDADLEPFDSHLRGRCLLTMLGVIVDEMHLDSKV